MADLQVDKFTLAADRNRLAQQLADTQALLAAAHRAAAPQRTPENDEASPASKPEAREHETSTPAEVCRPEDADKGLWYCDVCQMWLDYKTSQEEHLAGFLHTQSLHEGPPPDGWLAPRPATSPPSHAPPRGC